MGFGRDLKGIFMGFGRDLKGILWTFIGFHGISRAILGISPDE